METGAIKSIVFDENSKNGDLKPSVTSALMQIAEEEGYINPKIYIRTISSEGGNYLGVLYEVNIRDDTTESKETNLFVKHVIPDFQNFKLLSIADAYCKEIFAYRELSKVFTELQNGANVPLQDRFKMVRNYDESTVEAIVLENMSKKGFQTYKILDIMSIEYAKLCVQQLAKFHALSFVIEKRNPKFFENKIESLKQSLQYDETYNKFAQRMYEISTNRLTSDIKSKIDKRWNKMLEDYTKYNQGKTTSVKSLCHGDFKMNNVLFKTIEGTITEVVTVDYQLMYYGSPVIDFIYFVFVGTDEKFRRKHLNDLKELYYESLKGFLEYFDISVEEVYPKKTFKSDFDNLLSIGLVNSILLLPFLFIPEDNSLDLGKDDIMSVDLKFDSEYYNRFQDIVDDFIEWGYL